MIRIRFVLPTLILLLATAGLAACIPAVSEPTAEATPTITPSPTAIPTSTPTTAPTASPTPTATATPTPVTLPVTNGTPIPDLPYEVITAENVHRLRQIARYGYPRLLDTNPYRLTADGKTIAVGTTLGPEFYDAQTQQKTGGFEVEFLRDFDLTRQYLLTFAGETLTVWTRDGEKVREFDVEAGDAWALKAVALSPDGALLAVQRKKADWQEADKVDVYRVADGSLLDTVRREGAVFSPDGQYLATVFDGSVRLYPAAELGEGWEKRLPKQTLPWCGVMEGSCGLVFSPDGTLGAVVRAGRVDVYRVEDRKLVRQVSGWEVKDTYYLPQVQFADGRMLITTLPIYDRQGNVRVKAQAILVDIASGEWVSKSEVEQGFAYWDGEQVRTFTWKAEGEMPYFGRPAVKAENGKLIVKEIINGELVECENHECARVPAKDRLIDQNGAIYTLTCDKARCVVVNSDDVTLAPFFAPQDAYVSLWVFPSHFGDVVVIEVVTVRGISVTVNITAYRADGRRANIADNSPYAVLFDEQRRVAFGVYEEERQAIRVLDVDDWVVRRYENDADLLYFYKGEAFIAKQKRG